MATVQSDRRQKRNIGEGIPGTREKSAQSDNEDAPSDDNSSNSQSTRRKMQKSSADGEKTYTDKSTDSDFKLRDALLIINLVLTVFTMVWMTNQQTTDRSQIKSMVQTVVVEEFTEAVDDFKSTHLTTLEQKMEHVGNDYKTLQNSISSSENQITEIKINVDRQIEQLKNSVNSVVKDLNDKSDEIRQSLSKLSDSSSQLSEKIKGSEESVENLNDMIKTRVRAFTKTIDNIEQSLSNLSGSSSQLSDKITKINEDVQTTKSQQEKIEQDVEIKSRRLEKLSDDVEKLDTNLGDTKSLNSFVKNLTENYKSKVEPNLFNKGYFLVAFMILFVLVIISLIIIYRLHQRFDADSKSGTAKAYRTADNLNSRQIMDAIPRTPLLDDAVCIISFYENRQDAHKRLLDSTDLPNCRVVCHVIRRHDNIIDIPRCKVYLMCVEFSERHVIIEEPGLGLGSLHRATYDAILKLGGQLIILYTRDPGSRKLRNNERFNNKIYPATHQPELVELNNDDRFFSVYDELTTFQKTSLRQKIREGFRM